MKYERQFTGWTKHRKNNWRFTFEQYGNRSPVKLYLWKDHNNWVAELRTDEVVVPDKEWNVVRRRSPHMKSNRDAYLALVGMLTGIEDPSAAKLLLGVASPR